MPRPPPSLPPAPGTTTLAQLAAAAPPPRPVALPTPTDGSNPLGDAWCGVPEPDAGRSAHRRDYGFVQHSVYPAEATRWETLELHRFYGAPARTLAGPAAPSPRVTLAYGPQTSATRHAVRVLRHARAQSLRAPGEPELPPVTVASYVAGEALAVADARPAEQPGRQPAHGVRPDGPTWPPQTLPPAAAFLAGHTPWWVRAAPQVEPVARNAPPPPARVLACAGQLALPVRQRRASEVAGEAACVALVVANFGGPQLPTEALGSRFGAVRELSLVDAPRLRTLEGLLAALPQLRRLVLVRCPALVELGCAPEAFAARVELSAVVACPAFAAAESSVAAARR